jgi:hypothetical protein
MKIVISSTFSISMCGNADIVSTIIDADTFAATAAEADSNVCNPRHASTCALVAQVSDIDPQGGFLNITEPTRILVILPSRDLQSRSGEEITLSDLSSCSFREVIVTPR